MKQSGHGGERSFHFWRIEDLQQKIAFCFYGIEIVGFFVKTRDPEQGIHQVDQKGNDKGPDQCLRMVGKLRFKQTESPQGKAGDHHQEMGDVIPQHPGEQEGIA